MRQQQQQQQQQQAGEAKLQPAAELHWRQQQRPLM
jgi:hypothetical protein